MATFVSVIVSLVSLFKRIDKSYMLYIWLYLLILSLAQGQNWGASNEDQVYYSRWPEIESITALAVQPNYMFTKHNAKSLLEIDIHRKVIGIIPNAY